jgi:electron transport complex protein RnfA
VLGVAILVAQRSGENYGFLHALVNALGAGVGYLVAMMLFSGVRERIEHSSVPEFLKGMPITLVSAAIVALSFLGFQGIAEKL